MRSGRAPSYRAIAEAILSNDVTLSSIDGKGHKTKWYGIYKRIELEERDRG